MLRNEGNVMKIIIQKREPKKNPVAKHMEEFNRPSTHRDKKKDYRRKPKHEGKYYE